MTLTVYVYIVTELSGDSSGNGLDGDVDLFARDAAHAGALFGRGQRRATPGQGQGQAGTGLCLTKSIIEIEIDSPDDPRNPLSPG